ncbi:nucleotidyl transferase AbiEii/AbiGii toxin family protein [Nesterenkonia populi]|uniref:nucleotidyl transferase AbiEii/AbiGii toxin family protein n=1 Tax=Nesterenkonia populi TaxID=1591087 RepID=UPI001478D260|nr:nucleotidyl transferase AbiEii/AbiGii toxin family protein [Nesterenkonia populi]
MDAHLRFAVFDRFLCRVFADQERSEWLLKGGTGLLARVPDLRATKDVDLVTTEKELHDAQGALIDVAQRDLGDHVEFHFKSSQPTGGGENQPNVQARQVTFVCSDADTGRWIGDVKVDLAWQCSTGQDHSRMHSRPRTRTTGRT